MTTIEVKSVLPCFISDAQQCVSEIWHKEVTFQKGEYHLMVASSGTGKTSLMSYLFGERKDYIGEILFDGESNKKLSSSAWSNIRKHHISCIFQGLRLFNDLTVMENIQLKNNLTHHKTTEEIVEWLETVKLIDKQHEKVAKLSFGQQQRVAALRALCQPFDFLLADEPFSHLDTKNKDILMSIIHQELQRQQAGLLLCALEESSELSYHYIRKL